MAPTGPANPSHLEMTPEFTACHDMLDDQGPNHRTRPRTVDAPPATHSSILAGAVRLGTAAAPEEQRLGPRRAVVAILAAGAAAALLGLGWQVLGSGGWSLWEVLILLCLAANAPWLGLTAATGLAGLLVRLASPDLTAVLPGLRRLPKDAAITVRVVVAVCVRHEDMAAVLPPLEPLVRDLRGAPNGDRFTLAILSDTPDGADADREAAAVARLLARHEPGAVLYRRRACNVGFKAGNLMDFLDQDGGKFDFVLVLDADSAMSAATVRRLARIMQANPRLAILQPTISGRGAASAFTRLFGFGHRHSVRVWATGQAWWQGPEGPYWGHNALLRIAAFRAHCRLPLLPDGSAILSHDHVEAALLHAAGWAVRVLPDDAGSTERHPPDLLALLDRDLRWAAGNMQYRHLLRRRNLGRVGRLQMLQAMLHYALAPLWFGMLPLAALNATTGGGMGTSRGGLLALLAMGFLFLNLPKLGGYAERLLRPEGASRPGLLRRMGQEVLFGLLLDPPAALDRTITMLRLALGLRGTWTAQRRDSLGVSWGAALRRFGPHTIAGILLLLAFARTSWFAALASLPAVAGLVLAIPFCVLTAQPDAPLVCPIKAREPDDVMPEIEL